MPIISVIIIKYNSNRRISLLIPYIGLSLLVSCIEDLTLQLVVPKVVHLNRQLTFPKGNRRMRMETNLLRQRTQKVSPDETITIPTTPTADSVSTAFQTPSPITHTTITTPTTTTTAITLSKATIEVRLVLTLCHPYKVTPFHISITNSSLLRHLSFPLYRPLLPPHLQVLYQRLMCRHLRLEKRL